MSNLLLIADIVMILAFMWYLEDSRKEMRATREMLRANLKLNEAAHEVLKAHGSLCRTMYEIISEKEKEEENDPS